MLSRFGACHTWAQSVIDDFQEGAGILSVHDPAQLPKCSYDFKTHVQSARNTVANFSCSLPLGIYDCDMSELYRQLLDATIQHLEELKSGGERFVRVSPEKLAALQSAPPSHVRSVATPMTVATPRNIPATASPNLTPRPLEAVEKPLAAAPSGAQLTPQAKAVAMAELRGRAMVCQKCPHLAVSRKNVVFGVGDINSPLMFVGEAPGADEDAKGEPFVGKAGQLLTRMIAAMGFTRDTVYIANILKCRPDTPGESFGNRKPTPEEMKTCLPYLLAQIDLIQPKVIVALGATAVEGLFGKTSGITRLRGQFLTFRNIPVMLTYHPAYLLRNQSNSEKRKVWEDLLQVMEKLGMPISEKQRGYFLRG
jgi:uracil-DNA glycosylase family 4